jgi:hypothetical protein
VICFRDMTFCCSEQHKPECTRAWTADLQKAAERWWGSPEAPVAFSPFCGGEIRIPSVEDHPND